MTGRRRAGWLGFVAALVVVVGLGPGAVQPARAATSGAFDTCTPGPATGTGTTAAGTVPVDLHDTWHPAPCGWSGPGTTLVTARAGATMPGGYTSAVWLPDGSAELRPSAPGGPGAVLVSLTGWTGDSAADAVLRVSRGPGPYATAVTFAGSGSAQTVQAVVCGFFPGLSLTVDPDSAGSVVLADVSVTSTSRPCSPVVADDAGYVTPGGAATLDVAANDLAMSSYGGPVGVLSNAGSVTVTGGGHSGTATVSGTSITYTPTAGETTGVTASVRYEICPTGQAGAECGTGTARFTVRAIAPRSSSAVFFDGFDGCDPGGGGPYRSTIGSDHKTVDSYDGWQPASCGWTDVTGAVDLLAYRGGTTGFDSGAQAVVLNEAPTTGTIGRVVDSLQRGRRYTLSAVVGGDDWITSFDTALQMTAGSSTTSLPIGTGSYDQVLGLDFCAESTSVPISLAQDGASAASPVVDSIEVDDAGSWCDLAAAPDVLSVPAGSSGSVDVTANDTLAGSTAGVPDGVSVVASVALAAASPTGAAVPAGVVSVSGTRLTYRAGADEAGQVRTVSYLVCPPGETTSPPCATATVQVTVTAALPADPVSTTDDGGVAAAPATRTPAAGAAELAWTGFATVPWLGAAAALCAAGAGLVVVGRRRVRR